MASFAQVLAGVELCSQQLCSIPAEGDRATPPAGMAAATEALQKPSCGPEWRNLPCLFSHVMSVCD